MADSPDPLPPRSGIVEQVSFFAPGGPNGVINFAGSDGAGGRFAFSLRAWERGPDLWTQITWNAAPVLPGELVGNVATWRGNVIYWPLAELNGQVLRADFTAM